MFSWNAPLSKAVMLQEKHGTKDLRFYGFSIGWFGFGVIVGVHREKQLGRSLANRKQVKMAIRIIGKVCECNSCGWVGSYGEVKSMAGFEFCPSCSHRYTGFMPEFRPTKYAPDVASATSAEPDTGLESVPAVESDAQPRG